MEDELDLLKSQIICLRDRMDLLIQLKGTTNDAQILQTSQLLDKLLNKFYQLTWMNRSLE